VGTTFRPYLARFLPRGAPAAECVEQNFRFMAGDPGDINGLALAETAKEGEGNRLGRGARPAAKTPGREAARAPGPRQ